MAESTHVISRLAQALEEMLNSGRRTNTIEVRNERGQIDVYPVQYQDAGGICEASVDRVPIDVTVKICKCTDARPIAPTYGIILPNAHYVALGELPKAATV